MRWRRRYPAIALLLLTAGSAYAQSVISVRPGLIHHNEGRVVIVDAEDVEPDHGQARHLEVSQVLRSENGRAEIMLDQKALLRLAAASEIVMLRADPADVQVRLNRGSVLMDVRGKPEDRKISILAGDASVTWRGKGLYRIDVPSGGPPRLRVFRGVAVASIEGVDYEVPAKQSLPLSAAGEPLLSKFDRSVKDAFDRWSQERATYIALDERARAAANNPAGGNDSILIVPAGTSGSSGGTRGYGGSSSGGAASGGWGTAGGAGGSPSAGGVEPASRSGSGRGRTGSR
jgi:hypothetical protein